MIIFCCSSNLLDVKDGIIAHGCNAQGVMGSGVAKQLRSKYPSVYESYQLHLYALRHSPELVLGSVDYVGVSSKLQVANMITQEFYGKDGRKYVDYTALAQSMVNVLSRAKALKQDVHIPYMVGAGLGGGDLATIKSIYEDCSKLLNKHIFCHIYGKAGL